MAYYDYRSSYSSRPHDHHSSRSREHSGRSSRHGHSSSGSHHDPYRSQPTPDLPPRRTESRSHHHRSHKKRLWPPSPSVEDEKASLAREYGSTTSFTDDDAAVCMRGTIDQEPLLEDVEPPALKLGGDKRFVIISGDGRGAASENPPTGGPSASHGGRKLSLNTDFEDTPILERRAPSPYSYTKPSTTKVTTGEYFLSPEAATTSFGSIPRTIKTDEESPPSRVPRPYASSGKATTESTGVDDVVEDSDADATYAAGMREKRRSTRYSFTPSDNDRANLKMSLRDGPTKPPPEDVTRLKNSPKARYSSTRENRSGSNSSQSSRPPTPASRQTHPQPASSGRVPNQPGQYFEDASKGSYSRPSSPIVQDRPGFSPVPPSPNPDDLGIRSRPDSRQDSRNSTPPSVPYNMQYPPASPQLNTPYSQQGYEYSYPYRTDYGSSSMPSERPTARMGTNPPRIDVKSPSPARPSGSVPYPMDSSSPYAYMPSEVAYQYQHDPYSPKVPSVRQSPAGTPSTPSYSTFDETTAWGRPGIQSHRSANDNIPKVGTRPEPKRFVSDDPTTASKDNSRSPITATATTEMPACPRPEPTSKYDDWYTMVGEPNCMVCPDCLDYIADNSPFEKHFRAYSRRSRSAKIQCSFALPWIRTAWLLTLKRKSDNLDLLYTMINLNLTDPCPGDRETSGNWYGILDENGAFVGSFYLCYGDKKRIETLFPNLTGMFHLMPQLGAYPPKLICTLRTKSQRFKAYIESLTTADKSVTVSNRIPDMRGFINTARTFANLRECARDEPLTEELWYFMPSLPDFAVCEECFEHAVLPAIGDGLPLAVEFNRSMRKLPLQYANKSGTTCQLFSPRMRRIWYYAVRENDWSYLEARVMQRKEKELDRQINRRRLLIEWDKMERRGEGGVDRIKKLLDDEERRWKHYE